MVGRLYYYRLEDVDVSGAVTTHGPICVDWDADGMPDDWEIAHGLNPAVNDAGLDSDGDGVPNWLEYLRGTNPLVRDSDGDGIGDGAEKKSPGYSGGGAAAGFGDAGVQVLAQDEGGLTLELWTRSFRCDPGRGGWAAVRAAAGALLCARLDPGGWSSAGAGQGHIAGRPGRQAAPRCRCWRTATRVLSGYRVYPAPEYRLGEDDQLAEVFAWDEAAYEQKRLLPGGGGGAFDGVRVPGRGEAAAGVLPLAVQPGNG